MRILLFSSEGYLWIKSIRVDKRLRLKSFCNKIVLNYLLLTLLFIISYINNKNNIINIFKKRIFVKNIIFFLGEWKNITSYEHKSF